MKKLLIAALLLFPTLAFAQVVPSFDTNLSYGSTGSEVSALQEFLVDQHLLASQFVTGNFYSITLAAVKAFQTAESITPVSGYFGPISRETANSILAMEVPQSEGNAATTTLPVDLSASSTTLPIYQTLTVPYTPPQEPTMPVYGDVTPPQAPTPNPIVVAPPTCTVSMGVNMPPSSFVGMDNVAGIVTWTSTNAVSGLLMVNGKGVNLTPVAGGTIKDFTIHPNDEPYVATFVGTDGSNVTCTPNFTPQIIGQMVSLTAAYNSQSQTFGQDIQNLKAQAQTQINTLNQSGGEIGYVTGEIAQVNATEETQVEQVETEANAATASYSSQMSALSTIQ